MESEETKQSSQELPKLPNAAENAEKIECTFSPRFRSAAAMAGWDEEALLIASLVVEDTPDRDFKHSKRSDSRFKTPPTNSRRKRRVRQGSPLAVAVLDLDEQQTSREESKKKKKKKTVSETNMNEDNKVGEESGASCSSSSFPCMDRLREELSCAICLEICFEPSTTPCGHSFCKKCLRSAADKCGKRCPKCRQLIGNGRSCTVNTVLWNAIQLLFPQEVEARKAAGALNPREADKESPKRFMTETQNVRRRRRGGQSQDEDAALALRLQREEFMEAFRGSEEDYRSSSFVSARETLRAMASRAIGGTRVRGWPL
ncbi:hypothetical protein NMG60_11026670 [Bertholletia excelsa]